MVESTCIYQYVTQLSDTPTLSISVMVSTPFLKKDEQSPIKWLVLQVLTPKNWVPVCPAFLLLLLVPMTCVNSYLLTVNNKLAGVDCQILFGTDTYFSTCTKCYLNYFLYPCEQSLGVVKLFLNVHLSYPISHSLLLFKPFYRIHKNYRTYSVHDAIRHLLLHILI